MPDDTQRPVRRCVCADVNFEALASAGVTSFDEARERFGVGAGCGLCVAYVERMIRTGETAFEILPSAGSARFASDDNFGS